MVVKKTNAMDNKKLIILTLFFWLSSCSHKGLDSPGGVEQGPKSATGDQAQTIPVPKAFGYPTYNFDQTRSDLEKSIAEAKKHGAHAIRLLSDDLFLKATDAAIRGDSATALLLYELLASLKPQDIFIKQKLGVELIKVGKLEEALAPLKAAFAAEKEKGEMTGLILAGVYAALDMAKTAKEVYQKVLKANPRSEEACIFLSKAYAAEAQFKTANKYLTQCAKYSDRKSIFYYYQGKLALNQGYKKTAAKLFEKAWKVDSGFYQAALALGLIEEEKARFLKAANIYKKFLSEDPDNGVILERLVNIYFAEGKFKEVIPYAERLTQIDPENLNLKVRLGILYTEVKRMDDAIGIFNEILIQVPASDKILYYLGSLFQQKGLSEQAIAHFGKIPPSSPLFHDTSLQMAQLLYVAAQKPYEDSKQSEVAESQFMSFISERSTGDLKLELQLILADYYELTTRTKEAIGVVNGLKQEKNFNDNHIYYLASLLEKVEDIEGARKLILAVLEKDPENAHALNFLGYSFLEQNENMDQAYSLIKKAASLRPKDGYIRDSLGWYYYKTGKFKKALDEINIAQKLVGSDAVINKHLGIVYQAMKSYDKAKKYFLEALKHCKIESERRDVIKSIEILNQQVQDHRLPASR